MDNIYVIFYYGGEYDTAFSKEVTVFGLKNAIAFFKKQKGNVDIDYVGLLKGTVDKNGVVTYNYNDTIMEFNRRE